MNKIYLIQSISLTNFMLHHNTLIHLDKSPITLITGANGSGKTQILDAMILALGYHPQRIKKSHINELIGPFQDESRIELTLSNPVIQGTRVVKVEEPDISSLIAQDSFQIVVRIDKDSSLSYEIRGNDNGKKVLRRDIRLLFDNQGIRGDNKLAFTEEGTVNVFADQSGRNKFDLFLETTGLGTYRDNLLVTMDAIQRAYDSVAPLQRKLALEKEYLSSLEKARELAMQRKQMENKIRELKIEETWAYVVLAEKESENFSKKLIGKKREIENRRAEIAKFDESLSDMDHKIDKLSHQVDKVSSEREEIKSNVRRIDGRIQSKEENIDALDRKAGTLRTQQAHLLEFVEETAKLEKDIAREEREVAKSAKILELLGPAFFDSRYCDIQNLLVQSLHFGETASQRGISLVGPLFSTVTLPSVKNKKDKSGVLNLGYAFLGSHFFSYLSSNRKDFLAAGELFNELYPEIKPAFAVILIEEKIEESSLSSLIDAPPIVLYFLEHKLRVGTVPPGTDIDKGTTMATAQGRLLWDSTKFYLPWPGFGGITCTSVVTPGTNISYQDVKSALNSKEEHNKKVQNLESLRGRYSDLSQQLAQSNFLKERLDEIETERHEASIEVDTLTEEKEKITKKYETLDERFHGLISELDQLRGEHEEVKRKMSLLEGEKEGAEKVLETFEKEFHASEEKLNTLISSAQTIGSRPQNIRTPSEVSNERLPLEGKLEALNISPVSEEMYEQQKEKVTELENELAGSSEHLANLKQDMKKRFDDWHSEVVRRVEDISDTMDRLLRGVISGARLRLSDTSDPEKTTLDVEVRRSGKEWRDLSSLSGGEKVLVVEALILAFHLQTASPLHAIDECTQRLDLEFKAYAFQMVHQAVHLASLHLQSVFSPQFLLFAPDTLGVDFNSDVESAFHRVVVTPAKAKAPVNVVEIS